VPTTSSVFGKVKGLKKPRLLLGYKVHRNPEHTCTEMMCSNDVGGFVFRSGNGGFESALFSRLFGINGIVGKSHC
jgi:hypothetical protein